MIDCIDLCLCVCLSCVPSAKPNHGKCQLVAVALLPSWGSDSSPILHFFWPPTEPKSETGPLLYAPEFLSLRNDYGPTNRLTDRLPKTTTSYNKSEASK